MLVCITMSLIWTIDCRTISSIVIWVYKALLLQSMLTSFYAMMSFPSWLTPTSTFVAEEIATSVCTCLFESVLSPAAFHCKWTNYCCCYWGDSEIEIIYSAMLKVSCSCCCYCELTRVKVVVDVNMMSKMKKVSLLCFKVVNMFVGSKYNLSIPVWPVFFLLN